MSKVLIMTYHRKSSTFKKKCIVMANILIVCGYYAIIYHMQLNGYLLLGSFCEMAKVTQI